MGDGTSPPLEENEAEAGSLRPGWGLAAAFGFAGDEVFASEVAGHVAHVAGDAGALVGGAAFADAVFHHVGHSADAAEGWAAGGVAHDFLVSSGVAHGAFLLGRKGHAGSAPVPS